jgi:capsular polysaccharide biosynthesis protein
LTLAARSYIEKREHSRIDAALADDRISNVNVAQAPTLVAKPIRPNKSATLLIGLALATCGAVVLALVAESCDQSLKSPSDVEHSLDVSVLVTIPRMSRQRVMLN